MRLRLGMSFCSISHFQMSFGPKGGATIAQFGGVRTEIRIEEEQR
jgi:hypothetical protein